MWRRKIRAAIDVVARRRQAPQVEAGRIQCLARIPHGDLALAVGIDDVLVREDEDDVGGLLGEISKLFLRLPQDLLRAQAHVQLPGDLLVQPGILHRHGDLVGDRGGQEQVLGVVVACAVGLHAHHADEALADQHGHADP